MRRLKFAMSEEEIKFSCPFCAQHLACDESCCGQQISCPNCQRSLIVPRVMRVRERETEGAAPPPTEYSTTPRTEPWNDEDWNRHMTGYYRLWLLSMSGGSRLGYWFWGLFLGPLLLFLIGVGFREHYSMDFLRALGSYTLGGLLPRELSEQTEFWLNPFVYLMVASALIAGFLLARIAARSPFVVIACSVVFSFFILGVDYFVCCVGGWIASFVQSSGGN